MTTPDLSRLEDIYWACLEAMPDLLWCTDSYPARLIIEASLVRALGDVQVQRDEDTGRWSVDYFVGGADDWYNTLTEALARAYLATKEETTE